jgi:hypothetical protein
MLGVQRSSVTIVARKLQDAGVIRYRRGRIHVIDTEGLHDSACEPAGRRAAEDYVGLAIFTAGLNQRKGSGV